jgi:tRNA nucleotidyltransferase (CCA-adding enzyme)
MDLQALFRDLDYHLTHDDRPSVYLKEIKEQDAFKQYPFSMISNLIRIEQSPQHHPEGSVWNHTLLVLDNAAALKEQSEDRRVFMWAALLHDIGKTPTTKLRKGRITSYDHDKAGEGMAREFLKFFNCPEDFIQRVSRLVRWHMQILFVVKGLPFADIQKMKSQVSINEIALLGLCDRLGRGGEVDEEGERENIRRFIEKSQSYRHA